MASALKVKNAEAIPIIKFAHEHGFIIHAMGYEYYLNGVKRFGHCPCDKMRPACPCPQSIEEVESKGHCLCGLFWKDYGVYLKEKYGR
ncbi:hypothetical protein DEALK_17300 [Dehalogenimonas alkenigignens]|uniref:Uncharacterized protein n=1 Tax=Dehalogenimonas alkenigignens TaxID=1217799 RepID=A0A0W0GK32_9CHLR|nr:hypothetical protein [Dehalogenimonas alkenigignens]KTB48883.1 hypothetical protein DEALK_17300 [Dehalogenimonas alkenigignens]